ncbi:MAG TPA: enolase C-terminal domain-like protein, partial [Chthonomonadales bacterium]|nr:enolase C-terminal domain-like protein [Chthonomonadales bacterium]
LPCIAAFCCPPSHGFCKPVRHSIEGQTLDRPDDIRRINAEVRRVGLDLLQTDHILSGIDVALWDLLGKARQEPVYRLLGDKKPFGKTAYASVLFGDTPEVTFARAQSIRKQGFRAAKFGWGPFGRGSAAADIAQASAARNGLGERAILLLDAGTVWGDDLQAAKSRMPELAELNPLWLEEPFRSEELQAYKALSSCGVALAAGEGAHNYGMAKQLVELGGISYLQIDAGRIGGITTAYQCRRLCERQGTTFVNHTFTSNLALSASLQPFAGVERFELAEYPVELKPLARDLAGQRIEPDSNGLIYAPDRPGLGISPDLNTLRKYLVSVRMELAGRILYETPPI